MSEQRETGWHTHGGGPVAYRNDRCRHAERERGLVPVLVVPSGCRCACPPEAHIGEVGCACALPGESPCWTAREAIGHAIATTPASHEDVWYLDAADRVLAALAAPAHIGDTTRGGGGPCVSDQAATMR